MDPQRRAQRLHRLLLAGVVLLAAGISAGAYAGDVFEQLELDSLDGRFSIRGTQEPAADLAVVAIDDVTFDELDLRWPFRRIFHARVVDRLRKDGARAIAYDVQDRK